MNNFVIDIRRCAWDVGKRTTAIMTHTRVNLITGLGGTALGVMKSM